MEQTIRFLSLLGTLLLVTVSALPGTGQAAKTRLAFGGGSEGGTFQYFSNGIASRLSKKLNIPAGTYSGVDYDVRSFQDAALWVAGRNVPSRYVYEALASIYTKEGLSYLVKVKSTAKSMSIKGALAGIVTPVHPGAQQFWKEQGLTLTPAQVGE